MDSKVKGIVEEMGRNELLELIRYANKALNNIPSGLMRPTPPTTHTREGE